MSYVDLFNSGSGTKIAADASVYFRKKGVVLIDDDADFCGLMRAICAPMNIPIEAYGSLIEMSSFAKLKQYDVVVVDYYLKNFCGLEVAEYVDVFFEDLPVVLISGDELNPENSSKPWPQCIKRFICKKNGPIRLLQATIEELQRQRFYQGLMSKNTNQQVGFYNPNDAKFPENLESPKFW